MTQAGIELVRAERRRRWTRAEKEWLAAASFEPGVSEPRRDFRRLQLLRDWSHDEAYPTLFP